MSSICLKGPKKITGTFIPPGDKSISHRAIMFGALSEGTSEYSGFLEAEDCLNTLKAFQAMGVKIDHRLGSGKVKIEGVGIQGLKAPNASLNVGNSGTTIRLLLGILAGQRFEATLEGDASLSSRPMKRVTQPLKQMGAQIKGRDDANFAPLTIRGGKLKGIAFENKISSAQIKSAILFAGLNAEGVTKISEPIPSRDHTERFLEAVGAKFKRENKWLIVERTERLKPLRASIPGDMSAAAFFIAGAAMIPGSELTVNQVCLNPTRIGIINALKRMGADIALRITSEIPEPMGTVSVKGKKLKGTRINHDEIPSLIDELPILMTVMALSEGESLISGAEELRVKETDRILSMVNNLNTIGADLEELPDGCIIRGVESFIGGKAVKSYGDHRTAMSMAIATLCMQGELTIEDIDCVNTSFPTFFSEFERLKK